MTKEKILQGKIEVIDELINRIRDYMAEWAATESPTGYERTKDRERKEEICKTITDAAALAMYIADNMKEELKYGYSRML